MNALRSLRIASPFLLFASVALAGACSDEGGTQSVVPCGGACSAEQACVASQCVDVRRSEIDRGCNPLSQGECMYPWPSDFFTAADASRPTGLRLAYDDTIVPRNASDEPFPAADYNARFDGFSPNSQIRFLFPEGVDGANLPPIDDVARSLADDCPTVLLRADTGERWLHFAELDEKAPAPDREQVFVRPMKRLDFGARYVVALRGLVDKKGAPIAPSPIFRALRDKLPTDLPAVEALRPRYEKIFADLEKAGVPRAEMQLAWDFTTASNETLTRDARHLIPDVKMRAGAGNLGFAITEVQTDPPDHPTLKYILKGTFKSPSYLSGDGSPGTTFVRDGEGLPVHQGTIDAPMVIAVPRKIWDTGAPARVYLWGHGLVGDAEEVVYIASLADDFIGIATDFTGMAASDVDYLPTIFSDNLKGAHSVPERIFQSVVNFTTLGYLALGDLEKQPELVKDGKSLVDKTELYYMGGSQGGIFGGTLMAFFPHIERGGLMVGGGAYSLMVWRSTNWPQLDTAWSLFHHDSLEREFLFALFQSQYDYVEPSTYADHLFRDPLAGNPKKRIVLAASYGDAQVPNISSDMMARTYDLKMSAPAIYDVHGVPNETAPIDGSAYLQVDTKNTTPFPPKENVPASEDNGAHGSIADSAAVRKIIIDFLLTGKVTHFCEGPCDPE